MSHFRQFETENFRNNSENSLNSPIDYAEKNNNITIKISDYTEKKNSLQEKYIVFNITMNDKFLCFRRYKEFDKFHSLLKREFSDFHFPSFPQKWPFKMSETQLETRKNLLEKYLQTSNFFIRFFLYIKIID
jgi:hypothetical protein